MIGWLQSVDVSLLRFINVSWSNPFFDGLMPFVSGSPCIVWAFLASTIVLLVKGGSRGRMCVLMLALAVCLGNWLVCDSIKHGVHRLRPFMTIADLNLPESGLGQVHPIPKISGSFSMPSSHAANWFSAMFVLFVYYRRSIWLMLPMAVLVSLSRIYNGVHYPSDVLAGALLGMGYSAAVIVGGDALWKSCGQRWFPYWWERLPSLLNPVVCAEQREISPEERDAQWLRFGYILIGVAFVLRLAFVVTGKIELSEDEAYQWLWSKHLALSYYSKPPLIAYTQFLGTHLWGDRELGVRFFSPVIAATLSLLVLRFLTREISARLGVIVVAAMTVTPLTALGATVMTVDPLSVLFWTAAMFAGWRAMQPDGTTRQWLWVGLWIGMGFLSKYTNLVQCICWCVFFALWPAARRHLRRPGPYLALLVVALSLLPVIVWNAEHHWVTVGHVASNGQLGEKWHRTYVVDFLLMETGLLHPVFFVMVVWAGFAFWREGRCDALLLYLFAMGAPLFLGYFLLSWHSRILGNWIAPTIIPLFGLAAIYWWRRWESGFLILKPILTGGLILGAIVVVILHAPNLVGKILHRKLPAKLDLLRRVHGWNELARIAGEMRSTLEKESGNSTFIICEHYGFTSEISFYLPEAKNRVLTDPLVFFETTDSPENQFYYWPSYLNRKGQDALFVRQVDPPALRPDWLARWWRHDEDILIMDNPPSRPPPHEIRNQFDSFTDLGFRDVVADGNIVRRVQLIECHHLR